MELEQMRYVVKIAEKGSINRASKELGISQSAISKRIKELESEIECELFMRTSSGVQLTRNGMEFLAYAREILDQTDQLLRLYQPVDHILHVGKNTVSVCAAHIEELHYLTPAVSRWLTTYHKELLQFSLSPAQTSEDVLEHLVSKQCHLGIFRIRSQDSFYWEHKCSSLNLSSVSLWEFEMVALMSKRHPLASRRSLSLHDLKPYPQIINSQNHEALNGQFALPNDSSQLLCLSSIPGSYLLSSPCREEVLLREGLRQKQLHTNDTVFPEPSSSLSHRDLVVWSGSLSDAARLFIEYIQQELSTVSF